MEKNELKMKLSLDILLALGFVTFSIGLLLIIPYQIEKPLIFIGSPDSAMDPDLFPTVTASCLLAISLWYLLRSIRQKEKTFDIQLEKTGLVNTGVTLGVFLAYSLLMEPLGFMESSALMLATLTIFFGNRNILIIAGVSLLIPGAIYYLFTRLLLVYLPESYLMSIFFPG